VKENGKVGHDGKLQPVTREHEYLDRIHTELHEIKLLLKAICQRLPECSTSVSEVVCPECFQTFVNERGLRAHMKVHKKGE